MRHTRMLGLAAALLALGTAVLAGPAGAVVAACDVAGSSCPVRLHIGVAAPGLPGDTRAMASFSAALGIRPDVALSFTAFRYPLNAAGLTAVAAAGQTPMVTWEPFDPDRPMADAYPLRTIAAGGLDPYLREQAQALKAVGAPVALRFGHEMNASWYPWGSGVGRNTAADYVAAYRHVHDVVAAAGASNVTWVWSPALIDRKAPGDLAALYPGDDVVDWVGVSAYFDEPGDTYAATVAPTMAALARIAPRKSVYVAEGAVLPGPRRAAMIHDLVGGLVATPRVIGFTWFDFDIAARQDWRLDSDAAGLAALRAELGSGWFDSSGSEQVPAPLAQVVPVVTGPARVGAEVTGSRGTWRTGPGATYAGRWLRCTEPVACTPVGTATSYRVVDADLGAQLRYEVSATSRSGTVAASSALTGRVLTTPATPAPPAVEARDGALRVVFPAAPRGATGWLLTVEGRPKPVVPLGKADYWLTDLPNGAEVAVALAAVASSPVETLTSPVTAGRAAPLTAPGMPYVTVSGPATTLSLPRVPGGATGWLLTVDGVARAVPTSTGTASLGDLRPGASHRWSLAAVAGAWSGGPGSTTPAATGTVVPMAAPAAPGVRPGGGSVTLTLPAAPAGATAWRVTLGPKSYPDVPVGTRSVTGSGFPPGYAVTWTLKAVNTSGTSAAASGRTTP